MLKKPLANDSSGGQELIQFHPGDLLDLAEQVNANATAGAAVILTGRDISSGILNRTLSIACTDTLPTAAQIIDAVKGSLASAGSSLFNANALLGLQYQEPALFNGVMQQPAGFRFLYINSAAFAATIAAPANAGIITAGNSPLAVIASNWREYLVSILAGNPPQTYGVTTVNGNAVLSGFTQDQVKTLQRDMSIYGTGIAAGARILSVDVLNGTVTMSANATASGSLIGITFTPTVQFYSLRSGTL